MEAVDNLPLFFDDARLVSRLLVRIVLEPNSLEASDVVLTPPVSIIYVLSLTLESFVKGSLVSVRPLSIPFASGMVFFFFPPTASLLF